MNLVQIKSEPEVAWGPTGKDVYDRTYSRTKADGTKENWRETVERVVDGNLSLVPERFIEKGEREALIDGIFNFRIVPAGRHLWMSGVPGRQFLFNCYVSGWGDKLSDHFTFTFNQLMEGGGVGSNYSAKYVSPIRYPVFNLVNLHIVCSPEHDDYEAMRPYLSSKYSPEYAGAIEVEDSREGWTDTLRYIIDQASCFFNDETYWSRDPATGEVNIELVIDVSNIRASGKRIKTFGGTSAGPVPFAKMLTEVNHVLASAWELGGMDGPNAMRMDHIIATCVVSGNVRRSARMSIMHWNDPWIDWFLSCKEKNGDHWSTNISVEIDDEFITYITEGGPEVNPEWSKLDAKVVKAHRVYRAIVEGMLRNGEPGIWNSSLANTGEPNEVIATNPCGEICLEAWENCNLGHVNLAKFVNSKGEVDFGDLLEAHRLMTRFLVRATYGDISDSRTRSIVDRNRRIGVGHFGFAGFIAKRGILYSQSYRWVKDRNGRETKIVYELSEMKAVVDRAARDYAHQLRIPVPVKRTAIAPTGTIAKLSGDSEGIHPVYARYFIRRIRYSMVDPDQAARVEEYRREGYNVIVDPDTANTWIVEIPTKEALVQELEDLGIPAMFLQSVDEIGLEDLILVQRMYQDWYADNAVSYTVNVLPDRYSVQEVMDILVKNLPHLKGTTIMVDESRELAPYERINAGQYLASKINNVDASYDENCASGACPVR